MAIVLRLVLLFVLAFPLLADANPCTGESPFTDVPADASYCTNTEWLRNRGITIGCTATTYCPDDPVTRASMALFLNRLGQVITPRVWEQSSTALADIDLDASPPARVCGTIENIDDYPRRVLAIITFSGLAGGALDYEATLVRSIDGGATYSPISNSTVRHGASGARWSSATVTGVFDAAVGQLRVAVRIARADAAVASTEDFTEYACTIKLIQFQRNGSSTPFDLVP